VQHLLSSRLLSKNLKIEIYSTKILPVVLYGCETWSLTLREERKLRVFENTVLRRIFGPRRYEVTGEWRSLHNEELNDLYCSPNFVQEIKSRRMKWAGHVAHMDEERGVYKVLVGKKSNAVVEIEDHWIRKYSHNTTGNCNCNCNYVFHKSHWEYSHEDVQMAA